MSSQSVCVPSGAQELAHTGGEEETRRRRGWWLLVLLLLLLLLSCSVLQALLPTPRTRIAAKESRGVTAVFGVYGLHQPLGVAAGPHGEIVVADTGVQRAYLFDQNGSLVARLGGDRPENKVFSVDGVLYAGDTIYVADWSLKRVWMFDSTGAVESYFPADPEDGAYGSGGLTPYDVVRLGDDFLVSSRNGIYRFDSVGRLKGRFDAAVPGGPAVQFINGLAVDQSGTRVYAADVLNKRVVAFDQHGTPVWRLGLPDRDGKSVGFFGLPRGLVYTKRGLLVSDTFDHVLYLLDRDGGLLGSYGSRGVTDGTFNFPEGLDVAPDGLVYVADRENNRIQVLRLGAPVPADQAVRRRWKENHVSFAGR